MPIAKQLVAIEIDDAKISELTADTGGAPTYAAAVDVPNVVEVSVQPQLKTATLDGDAQVTAVFSKVTHLTGSMKFKSVPMDVLTTLYGGTLTTTGTTPNQTQVLALGANAFPKYFKLQGRSAQVEGLDAAAAGLRLSVYKCKLTGNPTFSMSGDYINLQADFTAVRTNSDQKLVDWTVEETKTALV